MAPQHPQLLRPVETPHGELPHTAHTVLFRCSPIWAHKSQVEPSVSGAETSTTNQTCGNTTRRTPTHCHTVLFCRLADLGTQKSSRAFGEWRRNIHNKESDLWTHHTENCHTLPHSVGRFGHTKSSRAFGEWRRNIHNKSDLWKHHTENCHIPCHTSQNGTKVRSGHKSRPQHPQQIRPVEPIPYTLIHPQLTN